MASKPSRSHKKASTKAASAPAASKPADKPKKERKPRKPPLDRAVRLGALLTKQCAALKKNVAPWKGDATPEQRLALTKINGEVRKLEGSTDVIASSLAFLAQTKYTPTVEHLGGRAKTFPVGAIVALKEKRYDPEIHGAVNTYAVLGETAKGLFRIQAAAKGSPVLGVPKGWLEKPAEDAVAPTRKPAPTPSADAAALDDDLDDENPGLDSAGE